MTLLHFRNSAGDDAGEQANDGRGKLALVPNTAALPHGPQHFVASAADRLLVAHVIATVQAALPFCPAAVITHYLITLKRHGLVMLVDSDRAAAVALMRLVAEAIVGAESSQAVQIAGAAWPTATGQDSYFRSVHERFSALRLQEIVQAAGDPANVGKAYFLCFAALSPADLALYRAPDGVLAALPAGVAATIVATPDQAHALGGGPWLPVVRGGGATTLRRQHAPLPPPVGLQRIWLRATARELAAAAPARRGLATGPRRAVA